MLVWEKITTFVQNYSNCIIMKRILSIILTIVACLSMQAADFKELPLYSGKVPYHTTDSAKIFVSLAPKEKATGRAVLICPGGAYFVLAMGHEGKDWASFFNNMGISVIVLQYRMPNGDKRIPISDAEQAMRLIRANAEAWNINPNDVGIMGSSAGGHLATTLATHSKDDAKPNFQILFYPVITMDPAFTHMQSHDNFLGKKAKAKEEQLYSNDAQVTRATPRAWIALSDDDELVLPANGFNYYFELYRHDVPASLHVYPTGGHGWGIMESFEFHTEMILELKAWLRSF